MKLSEAIRLGSMIRPQGHGKLMSDGRTCAIGAAAESAGLSMDEEKGWKRIRSVWPLLDETANHPCPPPPCHANDWVIANVIVSLNDDARWTREQIADWVETLEQADCAPSVLVADEAAVR
jgi:hypothetical protein